VPLNSICILRLSAIGDICNAVAAVQAIQRQHPDVKVTWVIGKIEQILLNGLPGVEFIVFDKSQGSEAFKQLKQAMANRQFDALLHMQVALRANWAARLIPAKRKIGFDWHRAKELHTLFTNEHIKKQTEAHVLEGFFAFAEKLGVSESEKHALQWNIPVSDEDQAFANEHIPIKSDTETTRTLVISPAASKEERNWLPERYAAIADYAYQKGFNVVLCGGPSDVDKNLGAAIVEFAQSPIKNLIAQTNLKQMLALLANANIVLAPDTGPAHMAVSQHTPVLGLYGHSNPKRTGPYLYQKYAAEVYHQNIKAQTGRSSQHLVWGTRVKGKQIMEQITVNEVILKFEKIVNDFNL
jgi:heptosyltransferase I